jgi:hypothetical protein
MLYYICNSAELPQAAKPKDGLVKYLSRFADEVLLDAELKTRRSVYEFYAIRGDHPAGMQIAMGNLPYFTLELNRKSEKLAEKLFVARDSVGMLFDQLFVEVESNFFDKELTKLSDEITVAADLNQKIMNLKGMVEVKLVDLKKSIQDAILMELKRLIIVKPCKFKYVAK